MFISFLLIALLGAITRSVAYPTGAPVSTCSTLLPGHKGQEPQKGRAPYTVTAEKIGANKVKVTISSPHGKTFKGFLLQARSADDRNKFVVGEFKSDGASKGLSCDDHEMSALTHVNADNKTEVTTEWTGPADVIFRATVVESFSEYWTNIDSEAVTADKMQTSDYDGCFKSKGCLGLPALCVNYTNCEVLFTYQANDDGSFRFALHGYLNISEYMAMGLSSDNKMGDDFVHECVKSGSDIKDTKQRTSWNEGKNNSRTKDFIGTYSTIFLDGLTTCLWTQEKDIDFPGKASKPYILLALGEVGNGELMYHTARSSTAEPVDLFEYGLSDRKVHGKKGSEKKLHGKEDPKNCCSHLSFGLIWLAFFGVFYASGRNALSFV